MKDYTLTIAKLNYRLVFRTVLLKAPKPLHSSANIKPVLLYCKMPSVSVV